MGKRWAKPVLERHQGMLFTSLDDMVAQDHPIRVFEAVLTELDWSEWERPYLNDTGRGQPPLHPMRLAGAILYGLTCKVRSSRELETATRERLDFRWFLEARTIDHATFAAFRTRHKGPLKELNRQVVKRLAEACEDAFELLVVDGTRIRANSNRHGARTAAGLERLIAQYTRTLNERLEQMETLDAQDGESAKRIAELEKEVAGLRAQIAQGETALETARKRDKGRRAKMGSKAKPVRVPVTDPDAMIVPNKEGGHAPNYTPTVAVDAASGAIVSGPVPEGSQENAAVLPAVEEARALGGTPKQVMADSAFANGPNLAGLAEQEIQVVMPTGTDFSPANPANRPDPTQPVAPSDRDRLPKSGKTFRSSAFLYDAKHDQYYCPMGHPLVAQGTGRRRNGASCVTYRCQHCAGCPLAPHCLDKNSSSRTVTRDQYQALRDDVGHRMATPEGMSLYKKRAPLVETVFARLKGHMGIRGFLLRGLKKVRVEWDWICCAYNLKLLLQALQPTAKPVDWALSAASPAFHAAYCLVTNPHGLITFPTRSCLADTTGELHAA